MGSKMSDQKLKRCLKMLSYLKKDSVTFPYYKPNVEPPAPLRKEDLRFYMSFTLSKKALMEYNGTDGKKSRDYLIMTRDDIKIVGIIPTDPLIDAAYDALVVDCKEECRNRVMQRLVAHEAKYNGLDFISENILSNGQA